MSETASITAAALRPPLVRQFAVFLENKVGALLDLTRTLSHANAHICELSVVDTADACIVRLIVDDPDHCRAALAQASLSASESNVVVVELPHGPEKLDHVFHRLAAAEVNIQYTYSLMVRPRDHALLALHCEDGEYAREVLEKAGFAVLGQKDISR